MIGYVRPKARRARARTVRRVSLQVHRATIQPSSSRADCRWRSASHARRSSSLDWPYLIQPSASKITRRPGSQRSAQYVVPAHSIGCPAIRPPIPSSISQPRLRDSSGDSAAGSTSGIESRTTTVPGQPKHARSARARLSRTTWRSSGTSAALRRSFPVAPVACWSSCRPAASRGKVRLRAAYRVPGR